MKTGYIILGVILATGTVACAKPEKEATETPELATTTEEQGMTDSGENTPEAFEIAPGLTAKILQNWSFRFYCWQLWSSLWSRRGWRSG